jgi:hypothetical protein
VEELDPDLVVELVRAQAPVWEKNAAAGSAGEPIGLAEVSFKLY